MPATEVRPPSSPSSQCVGRGGTTCLPQRSPLHHWLPVHTSQLPAFTPGVPCSSTPPTSLPCALPTCPPPCSGGPSSSSPAPKQCLAASLQTALSSNH